MPRNIQFIAACNPYRERRANKKPIAGLVRRKNPGQIAFRVHPPPFAMIQLMWDYQQLTEVENMLYIQKILENLEYNKLPNLIKAMVKIHEEIKAEIEISAVSLRDVERFKTLYLWFSKYLFNAD